MERTRGFLAAVVAFSIVAFWGCGNFVDPNFFKPSAKVIFYLTKKKLGQDKFFKREKPPRKGFYLYPINPKLSNFEANFVEKDAENAKFSAYFEGWYYQKDEKTEQRWDFTKPIDFELKLYGKWSETKYQPQNRTQLESLLFAQNLEPKLIDISKVENMGGLFKGKVDFNKEIGGWDTSKVANMEGMFHGASSFNQEISGWNVIMVWNMTAMFKDASAFTRDLSSWRHACGVITDGMFEGSGVKNPPSFDLLDLGRRGGVRMVVDILKNCGLAKFPSDGNENENGDDGNSGTNGGARKNKVKKYTVTFYASKADIASGANALKNPAPQSVAENTMVTKVLTPTNFPDSLKTNASANFRGLPTGQDSKTVHTTWVNFEDEEVWNFTQNKVKKDLKLYPKIFPKIEVASTDARKYPTNPTYPTNKEAGFANQGDPNAGYYAYFDGWFKTEDDSNWDFNQDSNKGLVLYGKWRETIKQAVGRVGKPNSYTPNTLYALLYNSDGSRKTKKQGGVETNQIDTSQVIEIRDLFKDKSTFNDPVGGWNTSQVESMYSMFSGASEFNQSIGGWNTGSVNNMASMFQGASRFDQPIGSWKTNKVDSMSSMFFGAEAFNQDLSQWRPIFMTSTDNMFKDAKAFNQDMSSWDWKPDCEMKKNDFYEGAQNMFKGSGIDQRTGKYPLFYQELDAATNNNDSLASLRSRNCTP